MTTTNFEPLGKRVDEYLSHKELQRFPSGTAIHKHAGEAMMALAPVLIQLMHEHEVVSVKTKIATATITDDGELAVTRWELPL